jgi:branched-subunit amino acid transport protein
MVERFAVPARAADALQHAGAGALTALVVLAVLGGRGRSADGAVVLAIGVGAAAAWRGWSMTLSVLAGGSAYAAALAVTALL